MSGGAGSAGAGRANGDAPIVRPEGHPLAVARAAFLPGLDGVRLRALFWETEAADRRALILPGRAEFAEKYDEAAKALCERGFAVACVDWRGQGLSDDAPLGDGLGRQRADLKSVRHLLFDGAAPDVIIGHSMGGAHALALLVEDPSWAKAVALSAPMLGVHLPTPEIAAKAYLSVRGRLGGPQQVIRREVTDGFDGNPLTRDRARWERIQEFVALEPRFGAVEVTVEWTLGALQLIAQLWPARVLRKVGTPLLLASAPDDRIVLRRRHDRAARFLRDVELLNLPNAEHEILQETDAVREAFWAGFDRLTARADL